MIVKRTVAVTLVASSLSLGLLTAQGLLHEVSGEESIKAVSKVGEGLNTTVFQTPAGKISVHMPEDMAAGDTLTGTVIAEPEGKTPEEIAQNQDELSGYVVEVQKAQNDPGTQLASNPLPPDDHPPDDHPPEKPPKKPPKTKKNPPPSTGCTATNNGGTSCPPTISSPPVWNPPPVVYNPPTVISWPPPSTGSCCPGGSSSRSGGSTCPPGSTGCSSTPKGGTTCPPNTGCTTCPPGTMNPPIASTPPPKFPPTCPPGMIPNPPPTCGLPPRGRRGLRPGGPPMIGCGQSIGHLNPFTCGLGAVPQIAINLRNPKGGMICGRSIPIPATPPACGIPLGGCAIPRIGQCGHPVPIGCPGDGRIGDCSVKIGGHDAGIMAASPRGFTAKSPGRVVGSTDIEVNKGGRIAKAPFNNLAVKLSCTKPVVKQGESTTVTVTVFGLKGLTQPVKLVLDNHTPNTVQMTGGDHQEIVINPTGADTRTIRY